MRAAPILLVALLASASLAQAQVLSGEAPAGSTPFAATGATTPRASADRAADVLNVMDFGAKGDCTTDDSAAINAAYAKSSPTIAVYFPRPPGGCYATNAPIILPDTKSSTSVGDGKGVSVIRAKTTMAAVFQKGTTYIYNGSIHDLTIDGNGLASYGVDVQAGRGFNIHENEIINATVANIRIGDGTHAAYENKVHHNSLVNNTGSTGPFSPFNASSTVPLPSYNILVEAASTDNMIDDNDIANAVVANYYDKSAGGNNFAHHNHAYGYPITTAYAQYCYWVTGGAKLQGNEVDGCGTAGFRVDGNVNTVQDSYFQWPSASVGTAIGIMLAAGEQSDLITGNVFQPGTITATNAIVQSGAPGAGTVVRFNPGAAYTYDAQLTQAQANGTTSATGNTRGANATDLQTSRSYAGGVAAGANSVIGGGYNNEADAQYGMILGGVQNYLGSAALNSIAIGIYNSTNVQRSMLSGWYGSGVHVNEFVRSFGDFAAAGDRQEMTEGLYSSTTDATPTVLTADGNALGNYNGFGLQPYQAAHVTIKAVCRDATSGDVASFALFSKLMYRGAGTAATQIVGGGTSVAWDKTEATSGASAWTLAITLTATNGAITPTFTGTAAHVVRCFATMSAIAVQ